MPDVLEIEFKGRRKEYFSNPLDFPFRLNDPVIVEAERGCDLGRVSYLGFHPGLENSEKPTYAILRKATLNDLKADCQNREREISAAQTGKQKIRDHGLEMKLVDVELQWDGRKMTFYFTAEGRVDFRELVKDLASTFRTRIDLRQIGARDETKRTGGYGVCGQPLCCGTFLSEFKPITTQMPRDQFLPLNPSKLSGVCGRLKCCLRYELDLYRDFQKFSPKLGHPVRDDVKGEGSVEKLDVLREQIHVRYSTGATEKLERQDFLDNSNWKQEMPKNECIVLLSKKGPAPTAAVVPEETPPPPVSESRKGERVTLLAGGGLGMKSGGADIQVGTGIDIAPASKTKKKRKRHRSRKKKGPVGSAGTVSTDDHSDTSAEGDESSDTDS